jgi:uncharacterized protein (DUF58 family)
VPLTARGRLFLGAALSLLVATRILGVIEFAVLAAAALVAVAVALLQVRTRTVRLEATRQLQPDRVVAGSGPALARLRVTNRSGKATPVLSAIDPVALGSSGHLGGPPARPARFLVPPLRAGEAAGNRYELATDRRGIYRVGPLQAAVSDPLGLAEAVHIVLGEDRLVVYPRVTEVYPLVGSARVGIRLGQQKPVRAPVGTDFHGLREYEVGDDLRRVHWPSTARSDELMLRQDETSWESETTTVLLDTRRPLYSAESFELAVEAAASVVAALTKGRHRMRFLTTDGFEVRTSGRDRFAALMEFLAGVEPTPPGRFGGVVESLRRNGRTGPLAVITGVLPPGDAGALSSLALGFSNMIVVSMGRSGRAADVGAPVAGALNVGAADGVSFALGWDKAVVRCSRRVPAPS